MNELNTSMAALSCEWYGRLRINVRRPANSPTPRQSKPPARKSRPESVVWSAYIFWRSLTPRHSAISSLIVLVAHLFMIVLLVFFLAHLLTFLLCLTRPPELCALVLRVHVCAHREA